MFVARRLLSYYCRRNAAVVGRLGTHAPSHPAARFPATWRFGGQIQGRHHLLPSSPSPRCSSSSFSFSSSSIANEKAAQRNKAGIPPPPSPQPTVAKQPINPFARFINWAKWFIGSVLVWIVPFWKNKIQEIEDNVEVAVDVVEAAVDVAETVAIVAEKVSSEVADSMPENGMLKEAAELVEHVSEEAIQELEMARGIIHQVDELREEVETVLEFNSQKPEGHAA